MATREMIAKKATEMNKHVETSEGVLCPLCFELSTVKFVAFTHIASECSNCLLSEPPRACNCHQSDSPGSDEEYFALGVGLALPIKRSKSIRR